MTTNFKFFKGKKLFIFELFGNDIGQHYGHPNLFGLNYVMEVTYEYLLNQTIDRNGFNQILLPFMYRLFRDKTATYDRDHILILIELADERWNSPTFINLRNEVSRIVSLDLECEMIELLVKEMNSNPTIWS